MSKLQEPVPSPLIADLVKEPTKYDALEFEQKLQVIADLVLYYADMVYYTLKINGKNRVDSCVDALFYKNRQEYWENRQMNLKKEIDLENTKARRGL